MKLTTEEIYNYVCEFYNKDISLKIRDDSIVRMRSYFYYLSYKYSTDVVTTATLKKLTKISQHGTVLKGVYNITDCYLYDKKMYNELCILEHNFRKYFDVKEIEYDFDIDSKDVLYLKNKIKSNKKKYQKVRSKLYYYKKRIKKYEYISRIEAMQ